MTGGSTSRKVILSEKLEGEIVEVEEINSEDVLNEQLAQAMRAKAAGKETGITFVAFTATPKERTIQLFGTRPDPSRPPASDNVPRAFHVYSMRQAIEEKFILDVLQNYISYKTAFQLAHAGKGGKQVVDASAAKAGIMGWVDLHSLHRSTSDV